jgi:hypothetical protein
LTAPEVSPDWNRADGYVSQPASQMDIEGEDKLPLEGANGKTPRGEARACKSGRLFDGSRV